MGKPANKSAGSKDAKKKDADYWEEWGGWETHGGGSGSKKSKASKAEKPSIECIAGDWIGDKGESYCVDDEDWTVVRHMKGGGHGRNTYTLSWDETWKVCIWGSSYYFDPKDVKQNPRKVAWYRLQDESKAKVMFTWKR